MRSTRTVVADLMDGEKAEMVFTDPPYNVAIDGNVSGLGKIRHREFAMASGEMTRAEFTAFLSAAFANLVAHSLDGSIHFICMDWRHMGEMLEAGARELCRTEEPDRLGQGQWRHGHFLSLPARTGLRVQERRGPAHQQLRARPARALSHQCLGVSRRQHFESRAPGRASRCIRRSSRSR